MMKMYRVEFYSKEYSSKFLTFKSLVEAHSHLDSLGYNYEDFDDVDGTYSWSKGSELAEVSPLHVGIDYAK